MRDIYLGALPVVTVPTPARRAGACGRKVIGYQWRSRPISSPPLAFRSVTCIALSRGRFTNNFLSESTPT
jgi:hypothetical protein